MAHEIYDQKFFTARTPAWHNLGYVGTEDQTPTEVAKIIGLPTIKKFPLFYDDGPVFRPTDLCALVRIDDDGTQEVLGRPVSDDYVLITPQEAVEMFEAAVLDPKTLKPRPVETMGVLGKGERLFITTALPSFAVMGDETKNFLVFFNPNDGMNSANVMKTSVRVVCANTYRLALNSSLYKIDVPHTKGAKERLLVELTKAYSGKMMSIDQEKAEAEFLAKKPFTAEQVAWIASTKVYAVPKEPRENVATISSIDKRREKWEEDRLIALAMQEEVVDLFNGKMMGYDSPAVKGTAFGALHAFAELESWRKARNYQTIVSGLLSQKAGDRGDNINTAYREIMALVG